MARIAGIADGAVAVEVGMSDYEMPLFAGSDYDAKYDEVRLTGQILRVYDLMRDGKWRTLDEIARTTGDPHASISAQLRNLRKKPGGSHTVEKRSRGEREYGLWEYSLTK